MSRIVIYDLGIYVVVTLEQTETWSCLCSGYFFPHPELSFQLLTPFFSNSCHFSTALRNQ